MQEDFCSMTLDKCPQFPGHSFFCEMGLSQRVAVKITPWNFIIVIMNNCFSSVCVYVILTPYWGRQWYHDDLAHGETEARKSSDLSWDHFSEELYYSPRTHQSGFGICVDLISILLKLGCSDPKQGDVLKMQILCLWLLPSYGHCWCGWIVSHFEKQALKAGLGKW